MNVRPVDANYLLAESRCETVPTFEHPYDGNAVVDVEVIERAPTLDWAPVAHGKWIMVSPDGTSGVCSACNRSDHIDPLATHCRYCGALMDLEKL